MLGDSAKPPSFSAPPTGSAAALSSGHKIDATGKRQFVLIAEEAAKVLSPARHIRGGESERLRAIGPDALIGSRTSCSFMDSLMIVREGG
jgi:hypothetical protein